MIFTATSIEGVVIVDTTPISDSRGSFSRLYCPLDFAKAGHPFHPVQLSMARNCVKGTLRGLHWQSEPEQETKLIRVTQGRIYDVAVDVRPESLTHRHWFGLDLDAENGRALLLSPGIAHGYLTLEPDTDVLYQITPTYRSGYGQGARWNDPAFGIVWPGSVLSIAHRDAHYPDYDV